MSQADKRDGEDEWWSHRIVGVVWSDWSVGGSRLLVRGKHPAARGRTGKQMGHREKHISVRSDIRRSLYPIRAAQEVQTDWDWWHQTAALQLWINEEKKTGQQNNKTTVSTLFLSNGDEKCPLCSPFQCAALCASVCIAVQDCIQFVARKQREWKWESLSLLYSLYSQCRAMQR